MAWEIEREHVDLAEMEHVTVFVEKGVTKRNGEPARQRVADAPAHGRTDAEPDDRQHNVTVARCLAKRVDRRVVLIFLIRSIVTYVFARRTFHVCFFVFYSNYARAT